MEDWYLELALALLLLAVSLAALAIAILLLRRWREYSGEDQQHPEAMLSKFREMHSRGELSDEEFRKIKTDISAQMQAVAASNDDVSSDNQEKNVPI